MKKREVAFLVVPALIVCATCWSFVNGNGIQYKWLLVVASILVGSKLLIGDEVRNKVPTRFCDLAGFIAFAIISINVVTNGLPGSSSIPQTPYEIVNFVLLTYVLWASNRWWGLIGWVFIFWGDVLVYVNFVEGISLENLNLNPPRRTYILPASTIVFVLAIQAAMIMRWRVGAEYFIFYVALLVFQIGSVLGSFSLLLILFIGNCAVMVLLNYITQFFIDHYPDFKNSWKPLSLKVKFKILRFTFVMLIPVIVLTWTGITINRMIREQVQIGTYKLPFLETTPSQRQLLEVERDVLVDALYSVDRIHRRQEDQLREDIEKIAYSAEVTVDELPTRFSENFELLRPANLSTSPCSSAVFQLLRRPVRIEFSMRSLCSNIILSIDRGIQNSFDRSSAKLNERVTNMALVASDGVYTSTARIETEAVKELAILRDEVKYSISIAFYILRSLALFGVLAVVVALIGAFQMVFGRILFDFQQRISGEQKTFQLVTGEANEIAYEDYDEIKFGNSSFKGFQFGWYVSAAILSLKGDGTHFNPRTPQPFTAAIRRLLCRRYMLTYIDSTSYKHCKSENEPRASIPGVHKVVAVTVISGQQLVVRLDALVGITTNVKIRSIYSTHMGANLLNLGTFYCVVQIVPAYNPRYQDEDGGCSGTVLLASRGQKVGQTSDVSQLKAGQALIFDRRAKFSLAQEITLVGMWIAKPDLVVHSKSAVVWNEEEPEKYPVVRNVFSLLRYILLPI